MYIHTCVCVTQLVNGKPFVVLCLYISLESWERGGCKASLRVSNLPESMNHLLGGVDLYYLVFGVLLCCLCLFSIAVFVIICSVVVLRCVCFKA